MSWKTKMASQEKKGDLVKEIILVLGHSTLRLIKIAHKVIVHSIDTGTWQENTISFAKTNYFFWKQILSHYLSTGISSHNLAP